MCLLVSEWAPLFLYLGNFCNLIETMFSPFDVEILPLTVLWYVDFIFSWCSRVPAYFFPLMEWSDFSTLFSVLVFHPLHLLLYVWCFPLTWLVFFLAWWNFPCPDSLQFQMFPVFLSLYWIEFPYTPFHYFSSHLCFLGLPFFVVHFWLMHVYS